MSLAWYAKRLANMSLPEIAHRGVEQSKRWTSRRRTYGWDAFAKTGAVTAFPIFADRLRAGATPAFEAALRGSVAKLLDGRFTAHGVDWPKRDPNRLFPAEVWRLDPVTGQLWPGADIYCFDLKYRHAREIGDIKYVWDFNRLQFLQPLAAAACLWPEDRAPLAAIEAAVASWMDANPPFGGLGWNSGIELALRAVTMVLVVSFCGDRLSDATRARIATILAAHLYWLKRYPSLYSSANNHLVAEAMGEFVGASALPGWQNSADIARHARSVLEREAKAQILADGVGAEQSPTYGAFTAEMMLVADLVAQATGRPLAPIVGERLCAFADFIGWLADGHGLVPAICDDDEGRVLSFSDRHESHYPVSVARAIAGHFDRAPVPGGDAEVELRDALFTPAREPAVQPTGLHTFREGGYTVVRETRGGCRLRLTMDHGPLGYLSIAAHGHADANSVTLSLDDRDVLVDPGTYLYHSGAEWRDWFRGTRAHNTLTLAGSDQSTIAGPFNWSHKAQAALDDAAAGDDWHISAWHDGYSKAYGTVHRRRVAADGPGLRITDRLEGGEARPAEIVYQFAPGIELAREGDRIVARRDGRVVLTIAFSVAGEIVVSQGGGAPEGGWVSPRFGEKVPAARLSWNGVVPPAGVETRLNWN